MMIQDKNIDNGKPFDWGRTSGDYARYRDIYPDIFYEKIAALGLCLSGQKVLDLGTGTGVLPRNMYKYGADWTGIDIAENQIREAKRLAALSDMRMTLLTGAAENMDFPEKTFDVITACQCFLYFDHQKLMPELARILKEDGKLLILYMAWLPFEDRIAGESEKLVLKYSPDWSGAGGIKKPVWIPETAYDYFEMVCHEEYDIMVPFTKDTWHGRIRACRGVGASLSQGELEMWDKEHRALLDRIAPERFEVLHYVAFAELKLKKG